MRLMRCQMKSGLAHGESENFQDAQRRRKSAGPLLSGKKKIMKNSRPRSRRPSGIPIMYLSTRSVSAFVLARTRLVCDKGQLKVVDDPIWKTPASSTPPSVTRKWRCV
jgi:hypothetical protein